MIYREYLFAELRRRKARTILTALGLGVGVGLVVMVGALSKGLDKAQAEVLAPLTGIGTDMTVTRPINPGQGGQGLSASERKRLQSEAGPPRVGLQNLGNAGDKFTRTTFMTGGNLSFDSDEVASVSKITGVKSASAGLTVNLTTVSGTVPDSTTTSGQQGGPPGAGGADGGAGGGPNSINFASTSVTGVDPDAGDLGPIQADQLAKGTAFSSGTAKEAVVSATYAKSKGLTVGESVTLKDHKYEIVGIISAPLGGSASDIYIKLDQLQSIADMKGRVNTMYVRADSTGDVDSVSTAIKKDVESASVTTSKTLADRVGGSIVDARKLAQKLGLALEIAALVAAILIAVLLTLTAVSKRTRELGTLKAIGWSRGRVVNQVVGESVAQGVLGGVVGVIIGGLGALAISAVGLTMQASVAGAAATAGGGGPGGPGAPGGGGPGFFARGADAVVSGTKTVTVEAPLNLQLIIAAVLLAVLGGAIAGGAGGLRAARLSPAEALRQVD